MYPYSLLKNARVALLEDEEEHNDVGTGEVQCNERLGGILKHYRRAA